MPPKRRRAACSPSPPRSRPFKRIATNTPYGTTSSIQPKKESVFKALDEAPKLSRSLGQTKALLEDLESSDESELSSAYSSDVSEKVEVEVAKPSRKNTLSSKSAAKVTKHVTKKTTKHNATKPTEPVTAKSSEPISKNRRTNANKTALFKALDDAPKLTRTLSETKALLEQGSDSSELSAEESDSDEFEEVELKGAKPKTQSDGKLQDGNNDTDNEEEKWEDALVTDEPEPVLSGDLELTLSSTMNTSAFSSLARDGKQGPSRMDREIRIHTHRMHVQFLMAHNFFRNQWLDDKEVQATLVQKLSKQCWRELEIYWKRTGLSDGMKRVVFYHADKQQAQETPQSAMSGSTRKRRAPSPLKLLSSSRTHKTPSTGPQANGNGITDGRKGAREWQGAANQIHAALDQRPGHALLYFIDLLALWWKKKFKVTAPPLRKRGYLSLSTLEAEIAAWRENKSDESLFGERIESIEDFRESSKRLEGSRDVGQQLFTALLRGLGFQAKMVASLQPVGFGWSQYEEGKPKKLPNLESINITTGSEREDISVDPKHDDADTDDSETSLDEDSKWRSTKAVLKNLKKLETSLPYPTYWTEVFCEATNVSIVASPLPTNTVGPVSDDQVLNKFYCRGTDAEKRRQVFCYVVAFAADGTAKDVTIRYLPKHQWTGKAKQYRMPADKVPIYNKQGKVIKYVDLDWFKRVMRPYTRPTENRTVWDDVEDQTDLVLPELEKPKDIDDGAKETLAAYKTSAKYVLERDLKREEALKPGAKIVRHFTTRTRKEGKSMETKIPVYLRSDVVACKTVENWHREGRAVKVGEQPLKLVPARAVTITRKRELQDKEREAGGKKAKQGLYADFQTEWIIPDPVVDGKISKNSYGNIDLFVPSMLPQGAAHIPLKGAAKVCRLLGIDYAEACTGFEFGRQMAVPVYTGVVVAEECAEAIREVWHALKAEEKQKELKKREERALGLWRRFLRGLMIIERINREYGDIGAEQDDTPKGKGKEKAEGEGEGIIPQDSELEGGFLREGGVDHKVHIVEFDGLFLRESEEEDAETEVGGFIRDDMIEDAGGFIISDTEGAAGGFIRDHNEEITGGCVKEGEAEHNEEEEERVVSP